MSRRNPFYSVSSAEKFEDLDHIDLPTFWEEGRQQVDLLLKNIRLDRKNECSMIEIGCGLGRMTQRFAEIFRYVYAFDVSSEMLTRARHYWDHLSNVDFILGNGTDLQPIASTSVQFVFSFLVLQHVPQPDIVLGYISECSRVLVPNGIAFLQFRTPPAPTLRRRLVSKLPDQARKYLRRVKLSLVKAQQSTSVQSLQHQFGQQYAAWRGCSVPANAVERVAAESGLAIEKIEGNGTQYTFFTFRKLDG